MNNELNNQEVVHYQMTTADKVKYAKYKAAQKADEKRALALLKKQAKLGVIGPNGLPVQAPSSGVSANKILIGILVILLLILSVFILRPDIIADISKSISGGDTTSNAPTTAGKSSTSGNSTSGSSSSGSSNNSGSSASAPSSGSSSSGTSSSGSSTSTDAEQHNPTPTPSTSTPPSSTSGLADKVKEAILKAYGVNSFSEIGKKDSNNLLQFVNTITDTSAGKIRISLSVTYSQTNRAQIRTLAEDVMKKTGGSLADLQSITAQTSDMYFVETATRSVL